MEGFSMEMKLVGGGCWAFDPLSSDVLLMPHARTKSIICEHEASRNSQFTPDKFEYSTLTSLTPYAPFTLINSLNSTLNGGLLGDDLNNNSHNNNNNNNNNNSNEIPLLTSNSSFLTLDPLVGHDVVGTDDPDDLHCFTGSANPNPLIVHISSEDENTQDDGTLRLPKFEDIHILRKDRVDETGSHRHQSENETEQNLHLNEPNSHFDFEVGVPPSDGVRLGGSPSNDNDSSSTSLGGGGGLYFSIHDLTSSYSSTSAPTTSTSSFPEVQADEDEAFLEELADFEGEDGTSLLTTIEPDDLEEDEDDDVFEGAEVKLEEAGEEEEEEGEGKQELKCKFCGFVCCSKSSLGIHERRHTGERPYSCKHCGRLFNSAQCCKHHERLHTGDKPFECKYCQKTYAVSTRLKRHERVHTREEPYKCIEPGCGKTFRWFDAFRDHRNTHNGVPLYLCSVCGKSFTSYLKFYYHERGHFLKRERERDKKAKLSGQGGNIKPEVKTKSPKAPRGPRKPRVKKVSKPNI